MKVAIDSGPLNTADATRGIGVHTREIIKYLQKIKGLDIQAVDFRTAKLSDFDIAHYSFFNPHFLTLPFAKPASKMIVTIHDVIRLIYPQAYPPGIKGTLKFFIQKFNLRNADAIITISETSKKDIVRFLGVDPQKIFVVYLAPQTISTQHLSVAEVKSKFNLPDKFVLYVGDVNYNKNLMRLANACKKIGSVLVMVGKQSTEQNFDKNNIENAAWVAFLKKYGNDKSVKRLGYVESSDQSAIYKLATVYCQPSLYEGFGLTLLEAFSQKCPVVSSRTQALVEVGGNACEYFSPLDVNDIARCLDKAMKDDKKRTDLIKKGSERLKNFSWEKSATETWNVYKKVMHS